VSVGNAVAGVPRPCGRRGGGRKEGESDRVGQTACGDGPDRVMLSGPGRTYVKVQVSALLLSGPAAAGAGLHLDALVGGAVRADVAHGDHLLAGPAAVVAGIHRATPVGVAVVVGAGAMPLQRQIQ
jgi:hypothetical protein